MKHRTSLLQRLPLLLMLGGLVMAGCSPRNVEVLGVTGPDRLETDETGTFQAETNEEAKPPVLYDWNFGDNMSAEGQSTSHAFSRAGTYTVTLTASNHKGKASDTGQTTVLVVDPPVSAEVLTILADPSTPDTRTAVRFGANVRGDAPLRYAWSFGDGETDNGTAPIHTYDQPGSYTVTLDVSNDVGNDMRRVSIVVSPYEADYCAELADMNAVYFERNSSILTANADRVLGDNLDILQDCPNLNVRVVGLAGPFERNPQELSEDRARAVQQYYADNGVAPSRIQTQGGGRAAGGSKKSGAEQFRRADTVPMK